MMKKLRYLLLMMLCAVVTGAWAEEETIASFNHDSNDGWTITKAEYATASGGYYKLISSDASIVTPSINWSNYTDITITISARKFGGPNDTQGKISVSQGTTELTSYSPSSTSCVASSALSISPTDGTITISCPGASSSKGCGVQSIVIKGTQAASSDTRAATTVTIDATGITNTDLYEGTEAGSLSATVMAGQTAVDGASVTWSSDDADVATIDASTGAVTLFGAGSTVITASYKGDDANYKPSSATYELTVTNSDPNAPVEKWVLVAPEDLQTGDIVAIVDQTSSKAMGNDNGTSSAPSATAVTLNDDKSEITSEVAATIQWVVTVSGTTTKSYQFGVAGTENYLYTTKSNNGLRVAPSTTNSHNVCGIYDNDGVNFITINDGSQNRYVGFYSDDQEWRSYKDINSNIKNTVTAFYKKVVEVKADITLDENGGNAAIIAANDGETKTVKVERTLSPDYYNTLYLPFAMSAEQITAAFGDGAQVATFTGTASNGTTFNFQNVTEMAAHKAYLVKPAATVNGFTVEGATIVEEPTIITPSVMSDNYSFDGTLDSYTYKGTAGTPTAVYYFTTSGTVKKLATNGTIKGLRAYMRSTSAISGGSGGGGRAPEEFFISFGDDVTAINAIDGVPVLDANAPVYNLAGQRVGQSYKGVVIQNGKKFVIK